MGSARYLNAGGKLDEGTLLPAEFVPTGVNELGKKFIENYTKKYRNAPDSWAAVGYSMMLIAGNAIKNAGPNPTREAVREAIDCANWGDAMQVQSRWAREMIEDYGAQMGRLLAVFSPRQAGPREDGRRARS